MKKLFIVLLFFTTFQAQAVRCGMKLVKEGDLKIDVIQKCGDPLSKEEIGYVDSIRKGDRITVLKIQELIYKINNTHYSFVFHGNKLKEIRRGN